MRQRATVNLNEPENSFEKVKLQNQKVFEAHQERDLDAPAELDEDFDFRSLPSR